MQILILDSRYLSACAAFPTWRLPKWARSRRTCMDVKTGIANDR
jgi:hypothetical protein